MGKSTQCACGAPVRPGKVKYKYTKKDGTVTEYEYNHSQCQKCVNASKRKWYDKHHRKKRDSGNRKVLLKTGNAFSRREM